MSDFAALLSQLDQSAKRAPREQGSENRGKRPRRVRDELRKNDDSLPADARELKIKLSFLCIGAQKAGTTWLHEMMRKIPGLGLPSQKELHFWDWHRRKGLGWYSKQFPSYDANDGSIAYGEITPCYLTLRDRDVREIQKLFPKVRIVFLARDLVDRAWSALTMELENSVRGWEPGQFHGREESLDPQTRNRIEQEADPERQTDDYFMERLKHSTHTQRSDYAGGIRKWLEHFTQEQILILNYKNVGNDPKGLLTRILAHLQVSDELKNPLPIEELTKRFNAGQAKPIRPSLRKKMESYLRPYAKAFNELLRELGYKWTLDEYD
jgi:hypothetical protein